LAYDPLRFKHHGASEALKSWTLRKAPFDVDTLEQWQVVTLKPEGGELKQVKGDVKQENYDDVVMHPREVTADCLVVLMQWRRGQRTVEHRHAYYVDAALHISSVSQSDEETVYERWKDSGLIKPQTQ
jgi:hypothetical protein